MKNVALFFICFCILSCGNDDGLSTPSQGLNPTFAPSPEGGMTRLLEDEFQGEPIIIFANVVLRQNDPSDNLDDLPEDQLRWNFVNAYKRELDGTLLEFKAVNGDLPIVMEDQEGNRWDLFGVAQSGPRQGQQLEWINSGLAFWFAYGTLYHGTSIYNNPSQSAGAPVAPTEGWDVSTRTIIDAAGLDAIPALEKPEVIQANDPSIPSYMQEDDIVVGMYINGEAKAYPHPILDWHEIVNDELGNKSLTVTYCPLTGTTKVYERANLTQETFGVSGFLYNSNLMPYDRASRSVWLQLEGRSVNGARRGEQLGLLSSFEMPWSVWKSIYPNTTVVSTNTGIARNYGSYPYGDYRTNNDFIFSPVEFVDERLPTKERVFGIIIDGEAKVYRKTDFFNR